MNSLVDKLYVGILVTVPVHLSKLSDVLKNDVTKKEIYIYIILRSKILNIKYLILLT